MTNQYAVLGNPIEHSLSPQIHRLFAQQTNQSLDYTKIQVPLDKFEESLHHLYLKNYEGLNITVPFKTLAWELAESKTERAQPAGAVNTLMRTESGWKGDNTDGVGLVNDLMNKNISLEGKDVLIIGAGGATRGVLLPLLDSKPASLHIANRTTIKAIELAETFSKYGSVTGSGLDGTINQRYNVIINATAASLDGKVPNISDNCLAKGGCCYDMFYAAKPTAFMTWGQNHLASVSSDGLGMLVEQAAESFYLWRGIRPKTKAILKEMRKQISSQ